LASKQCVFVPLSDADPTDSARRGTHWRLLVYSRPSHSFHLYDSSDGGRTGARGLSRDDSALVRQLAGALRSPRDDTYTAVREPCPQQQNGYDCGMYVFCIVELIFCAFMPSATSSSAGSSKELDSNILSESVAMKAVQSPSELAARLSNELTPSAVTARRLQLFASARALREEWLASEK
jgi:Ulp1 family protease